MIIKLLECNTVHTVYDDGKQAAINSTHSLKAADSLSKSIADSFPFRGAVDANRPATEHIHESIVFDGLTVTARCCDCEKDEDGLITKSNHETTTVTPLDDYSDECDRVKQFCDLVFSESIKSDFIDTLETVDEPQIKRVQDTLSVPKMVDVPVPAVLSEDGKKELKPATVKRVQETKPQTRSVHAKIDFEIVNGEAVEVMIPAKTEQFEEPQFDVFPKVKNGQPIMIDIPDLDGNGDQKVITKIQYKGALYTLDELSNLG